MGDIGFAPYWEEYWETGEVPLELVYTDIDQITNIATKAREWFCVPQYETIITSFAMQQPLERVTRPYALTSTEGKLVLDAWEVFAMPSSMKDKELGWIHQVLPEHPGETHLRLRALYLRNPRQQGKLSESGGTPLRWPVLSQLHLRFPKSYPGLDPDATVEEMEAMLFR